MSKFLFALQEGGGDTPPLVSLAGALVAAGHEVARAGRPACCDPRSSAPE